MTNPATFQTQTFLHLIAAPPRRCCEGMICMGRFIDCQRSSFRLTLTGRDIRLSDLLLDSQNHAVAHPVLFLLAMPHIKMIC
ncbi:unnamed protein product [Amoebophrya sp. A120]|nr:unnamed protein product [Amoebophrya sp. A120]|eukprot:GSA120T00021857001.1